MKLHATILDNQTEVKVSDEGRRVLAEIGGRAYTLEVHESGDGYLIVSECRVWECRVAGRPESGQPVLVMVGTNEYAVTITDPRSLRSGTAVSVPGGDTARIVASMPGKVVRVLVEVGAQVDAGDGIIVVEAMKMQNEMKSPKAGTVISLHAETGATVNGGDVLAVIE